MGTPNLSLKEPCPVAPKPWRPVHRFNVRDVVAELAKTIRGVAVDGQTFSDLDFESDWNLWLYVNLSRLFRYNDNVLATLVRWFGQPVLPSLPIIYIPYEFGELLFLELSTPIEALAPRVQVRHCYSRINSDEWSLTCRGELTLRRCALNNASIRVRPHEGVWIQECYTENVTVNSVGVRLFVENSVVRHLVAETATQVLISNSTIGNFRGPLVIADRLSIVHDVHITNLPEGARDLWLSHRGSLVGGGARLYQQIFEDGEAEALPALEAPTPAVEEDAEERDTDFVDL